MRLRSLNQLVSAGLLVPKAADPERIASWVAQASRDLDVADKVLFPVDRRRALAVVYEVRIPRVRSDRRPRRISRDQPAGPSPRGHRSGRLSA